ncbi:MAG: septal ring lytic transglycosylase RlpA family protein [Chlorobiaceae bacterium]|nr:septal ring lytic transglycosylase RlpA family protein [Chlorobiaceae bacterium]NTW73378.1 septal ring lytic transglycosylase RlpA family protein [Chlorobiaceae bacterium]
MTYRNSFIALFALLLLSLGACSGSRGPVTTGGRKGLSPEEAYRLGKIKNAPYIIAGRVYVPMSFEQVYAYEETGIASWYGQETLDQHNGQPTAYGEIFDPGQPSAAHKYLPLPMTVRVTNLDTNKSIVVRVNDRGPFVDNRVIDLSAEAAKQLGFYEKGTARVRVESVFR